MSIVILFLIKKKIIPNTQMIKQISIIRIVKESDKNWKGFNLKNRIAQRNIVSECIIFVNENSMLTSRRNSTIEIKNNIGKTLK